MGVVFRAEEIRLERVVAVKVMRDALQGDPAARERFYREAKAAAKLRHDHIVSIYHVGEERDVAYSAMELLQGESLEQRLRRDFALPVAEVLRIGREIASGLAAAHRAGLIHRDIKPANVWLEAPDGRVKILDFGLARIMNDDDGMTQSGVVMGTPAYMAPEQASDEAIDARCDLFSLGCVLYAMATGEIPFKRRGAFATLSALVRVTPVAPSVVNPAIPLEVSQLVMALLEKEPDRRLGPADEVVRRIRQIEANAMRPKSSSTAWPRGVRNGGVALTCLLAIAGAVLYWPTSSGVVRIEIDDPSIQVAIDDRQVTFREPGKPNETVVEPGEHGLRVTRGELSLETDKFVVKRRETVQLRVSIVGDKAVIARNGVVIAEKAIGNPSDAAPTPARQDSESPQKLDDGKNERPALEKFIALGGTVRCDQTGNNYFSAVELPAHAISLLRLIFAEGMRTPDSVQLNSVMSKLNPYWIELRGDHRRSLALLSESPIAPTLKNLTLRFPELRDSDFEHVAKFTALGSLRIFDPPPTGDGLHKLKHLRMLETLELSGSDSQLSLDTVAAIAELPGLVELNASGCHLSVDHCRALANSKVLNHLTVGSCNITDEGVAWFSRMRQIRHLSLVNNPISARGLVDIKSLPNLESLNVAHTRVTAEVAAQLRREMPRCKIDSD